MNLEFSELEVAVKDAYLLKPEEFTMARKSGLGASDASVILGLQSQWRTTEDVIEDKLRTQITPEEIEIGNKASVRKGRDLEPLILQKASEFFNKEIIKPTDMYRFKNIPYLTINFDGLMNGLVEDNKDEMIVPVEAKYVTTYGEKYYDADAGMKKPSDLNLKYLLMTKQSFLKQDIETKAKVCGIPPYYYAQVQQQLLGLDAPYGFLVALHEKTWELSVHFIPADAEVQFKIIQLGKQVWNTIESRR